MQATKRELALDSCEKIFSSTLCHDVITSVMAHVDLLIDSFISDPGLWWTGIGTIAGVIALIITVKKKDTVVVVQQIPEAVTRLLDESKAGAFAAETVIVKFPSADELTSLKAAFTYLKLPPKRPRASWMPCFPLQVNAIARKNAERHFYARGSERSILETHGVRQVKNGLFISEYAAAPIFQSWSDDGEEILIACDQHGVRRYRVSSQGLALDSDHYSQRPTLLWRQPPKWCRWCVHPSRGLLPCYYIDLASYNAASKPTLYIHVGHFEPICIDLTPTRLRPGGLDAIGRPNDTPNPWRPGHAQLLMMDGAGISSPDGGARALSLFQVSDAIRDNGIAENHLRRFELDHVIPPGYYVRDYSWSAEGHFFALQIGNQFGTSAGRVLVIDSLKGQVLAISDWNREMIGWHPDSGDMLLARPDEEKAEALVEILTWDVCGDQERPVDMDTADEDSRRMALSFIERRSQHSPRQLNANGTLWLAADGQDLVITSTNKNQELYIRIAHKGSAIWSPTDPSLFATIGDADSNDSLCLWQIAGET